MKILCHLNLVWFICDLKLFTQIWLYCPGVASLNCGNFRASNVSHTVVLRPLKAGYFNFTSATVSYLAQEGGQVVVSPFGITLIDRNHWSEGSSSVYPCHRLAILALLAREAFWLKESSTGAFLHTMWVLYWIVSHWGPFLERSLIITGWTGVSPCSR